MSRRFIVTGPPGAGKTTLIRGLAALGHTVVSEAATDVIAREQAAGIDAPWEHEGFVQAIADVQRLREAAPMQTPLRFSDRSLFCTLALGEFLGREIPTALMTEAEQLAASGWFERRVIYVEPLAFIEATPARRISLAEARRFGEIHEDVYQRFGFELARIAPADVEARLRAVLSLACV